jgi:hypothetical protein
MLDLDTDGLVNPADKSFVEMAYAAGFKHWGALQRDHNVWDVVWADITLAEARSALKDMKSGTAGGASSLTYEVRKALDDENISLIVDELRRCLKNRGLPKVPKTDAGLADLALTRPIALMEVIGKLFEKNLFDRIRQVLVQNAMLDDSQHGGMPLRSTAPPMHNLAEVIQDAQLSGQELHVLSADLTKAFDTLEHWSQVMSWRALGMPSDMAEMLMRMDQEGETAVILGQGRTTADVLGEKGWFTSGRGVRQGSIGGPIKWIVYMNFWLTYMHKKHEGQGYRMSQSSPEDREILGQMFIDDSNWFSNSVANMHAMIHSNELFVHFYGLSFNKKKCEHVAINQGMVGAEWTRPRWGSGEILVEKIRCLPGNQKEQWKTQHTSLDWKVIVSRDNVHKLEAEYAEVGDIETAYERWDLLDQVQRMMIACEKQSRDRWWAQDAPVSDKETQTRGDIHRALALLLSILRRH